MSVFKRFGRITKANIHHLRGSAGNKEKTPGRLWKRLYRDYREKKTAADAAAARLRMLESKLLEYEERAAEWAGIAVDAAAAGKESLARDAVRRQADFEPKLEELERRYNAQKSEVERLDDEVKILRLRLEDLSRGTSGSPGEADFDQRLSNYEEE